MKQVLAASIIEEIALRLLDDGRAVDQEHEVAIALRIQVPDFPCHERSLARAGGRVEHQMHRTALLLVRLEIVDSAAERLELILAQRQPRGKNGAEGSRGLAGDSRKVKLTSFGQMVKHFMQSSHHLTP